MRSTDDSANAPLIGLFVGGQSRRMQGVPKGTLQLGGAGPTLIERLVDACRQAAPGAPLRLVGEHPAYQALGIPMLADARADAGPMAGLLSLLREAERLHRSHAIALACDMPYVTAPLLEQLLDARKQAPIVSAKRDQRWQPFFARYAVATVLPVTERLLESERWALQAVFDEVSAQSLSLSEAPADLLRDWDTPEDCE